MPELDLDDKTALYVQIQRILAEEIATGVYEPGQQLPTRNELCARFGVSGMTVGAALAGLARDGLVVTRQGAGTYVSSSLRPADAVALVPAWVVLNQIHGPLTPEDPRCRTCRDDHGLPTAGPCWTYQQLAPVLDPDIEVTQPRQPRHPPHATAAR